MADADSHFQAVLRHRPRSRCAETPDLVPFPSRPLVQPAAGGLAATPYPFHILRTRWPWPWPWPIHRSRRPVQQSADLWLQVLPFLPFVLRKARNENVAHSPLLLLRCMVLRTTSRPSAHSLRFSAQQAAGRKQLIAHVAVESSGVCSTRRGAVPPARALARRQVS